MNAASVSARRRMVRPNGGLRRRCGPCRSQPNPSQQPSPLSPARRRAPAALASEHAVQATDRAAPPAAHHRPPHHAPLHRARRLRGRLAARRRRRRARVAQEDHRHERVPNQLPPAPVAALHGPGAGLLVLLPLPQLPQLRPPCHGQRQGARPEHHAAGHHDVHLPHRLWCAPLRATARVPPFTRAPSPPHAPACARPHPLGR